MAALKFADYLQRSISLFLFGTTLFAGYMTAQSIRRRRQARALAVDEPTKHEVNMIIYSTFLAFPVEFL